jgi:hypothetical protein
MLAAAAVSLAHVGVYVILVEFEWRSRVVAWDGSDAILIEIATGAQSPPPRELLLEPLTFKLPPVVIELPGSTDLGEPPGGHDWLVDGAQAAAGVGALSDAGVRSFDTPERPPEKPRKKPFGWDKTHTQRVEIMPGEGIRIRLSDRCDLFVSLIPMAGCSLGTIPARGDLFDGMKEAVELGDWNDSSAVRK